MHFFSVSLHSRMREVFFAVEVMVQSPLPDIRRVKDRARTCRCIAAIPQ